MRTPSTTAARRYLRPVGVLAAALVIGVALSGTIAFAQANRVNVTLDFAFVASGKEMPAGTYQVEVEQGKVTVTPRGKGPGAILAVLTRLGRHDNDSEPELVFDKVGGKLLLSEVWLPGLDGYLLLATAAEHDHAVHGGSRPHK